MAKEDFCFTYYDGDAARDMAHMNRLERGAYGDFIVSQRKFGHLSLSFIKKTFGGDFDAVWESIEIILQKDEQGKYFIEWLEMSVQKMRLQARAQSSNGSKGGRPKKANENPNESQTISEKKPLEDGDGYEDELENKEKGVQGEKQEMPLGALMQQKFFVVNTAYPSRPANDLPAMTEIAKFLNKQLNGTDKQMHEMDVGERGKVLTEWAKWCAWYKSNGGNKSLDYLVKFKLQEIFSELKNGSNGTNQRNFKTGHANGGQLPSGAIIKPDKAFSTVL